MKLKTEVSQAPLPKGLKGLKGSERGEKGRMLCAIEGGGRGKGLKPCIIAAPYQGALNMPFSPLYTLYSFRSALPLS